MKSFTIFMACIAVCVTAQAQPYRIFNGEDGREKEDIFSIPHSLYTSSKSVRSNTLFPLEALHYSGDWYDCNYDSAAGTLSYKYHEDWTLSEIFKDFFPSHSGFYAEKHEFNNTFVMEGRNMVDTSTYYSISNGIYTPSFRYCHNYHYYDKFETDSFFYERIRQQWDPVNKKWNNVMKQYEGYADTVLWNRTRYITYNYDATELSWKPSVQHLDSLIYNSQGFVIARMKTLYFFNTNHADTAKHEYYLNEDGSIYAIDILFPQNDGWELVAKWTDITWALWLGYGGFNVMDFINRDNIPINGKRNKQTSETGWVKNGDEWEWVNMRKKYWDIDDCGSNTDTLFNSLDGGQTSFPRSAVTFRFDEYGNETEIGSVGWEDPDEHGNQLIKGGSRNKMQDSYDDNGWYKFEGWIDLFNEDLYQWDSITVYREEVVKWIDPNNNISELLQSGNHLLSIFPNPVSGIVTISASAEMQQLSIFDITGRMVANSLPTGERAVFDTGALPQGVYLVRALLKDGGVRTGKVVVR